MKNKYVVIVFDGDFYKFHVIYGMQNYNKFLEFVQRRELDIVAEEGGFTEYELNKLTGYSIKTSARKRGAVNEEDLFKIGEHHLDRLVEEFNNSYRPLDIPEELKKLREFLILLCCMTQSNQHRSI